MTTETVTDYETREVQREVTTCDRQWCEHSSTDESEFIEVAVNPRYRVHAELDIVNGEARERESVAAEATVSLDLCEQCFTMLFTDVAVSNPSDVELEDDGITVTETVEENPYLSVSLPEGEWLLNWLLVTSTGAGLVLVIGFSILIGMLIATL